MTQYRELNIYQIEYLLKRDFIMYLKDNNIISINDKNIISVHDDFKDKIKNISFEILKEDNSVYGNIGFVTSYFKFLGFCIGIEYYNNNWIDDTRCLAGNNIHSQPIVKFIDELMYCYYDRLYNIIDTDKEISIKSYFNKQEIILDDRLSNTTSSEIKYDIRLTDINEK